MAGGPSGTGWSDLVVKLNDYFQDQKRGNFAKQFKDKHGRKGDGDASGKRPYKFGQFVDQFVDTQNGALLSNDNQRAQFLIDSGTRHWDPSSLELLEHAIKQSLTNEQPDGTAAPKRIFFNAPTTNRTAVMATAQIKITGSSPQDPPLRSKADIDRAVATQGATLTIDITCPPPNLRPRP